MLVFGESEYDTQFLAHVIRSFAPPGVEVDARKTPPILIRDAKPSDLPGRASRIAAIVRAAATDADVIAVVAHEDTDAVEPSHKEVNDKIVATLEGLSVKAVPAAAAWETEAWLMQWPHAIALYRPSWASVEKYVGKNVGMIQNAKEDLTRSLRPRGRVAGVRDYRESDAPEIGAKVRDLGHFSAPRATSASYADFLDKLRSAFH